MAIISWKYIGFAVILFLAGLQSIPEELSEAAAIDGASYWQIQRRITLPLLGPTIRIWAFLSIIGSLQLFDLVYIIWGQYVAATAGTSTMATYMVAQGRDAGNYGYGNAVAVVMFLISLVIALLYQRFVLRRDTEGALTEGEELMATLRSTAVPRRPSTKRPPAAESPGAARSPTSSRCSSSRSASPRCSTSSLGGFRTNSQITVDPAGLPHPWVIGNYLERPQERLFWREFANSAIVALPTTVGVVVLGLMVSFVLARYDFKLNGAMYSLFAAGLMFPMTVAITPLYILIKDLGLDEHRWAASSCRRSHSPCRRPSSSWCRSCRPSRTRSRRPPLSTARAASGSSSAWSFRCRCPAWSPSASWRSSRVGTATSCRCSS